MELCDEYTDVFLRIGTARGQLQTNSPQTSKGPQALREKCNVRPLRLDELDMVKGKEPT